MLELVRSHICRLGDRGVHLPPDAAAHLATAEADRGRAWGCSDPGPWSAAAAAWDELRCPYRAAVARYRESDAILRSRGDRVRAAIVAGWALRTAEDVGAAPLVEQIRLLAQRGRLDLDVAPEPEADASDPLVAMGVSPREREVLELLAQGRTNRQIADVLYISDKTASVHVTHVLRKLGVATRIEAAAVAQRLGLGR